MSEQARIPLYYTFGNHMHWVDMQWLWGYEVLPGSVADMLKLCRETGARGNVNFDAVGYEKMAAECPEALADLREAVAKGIIEPVGCSYGQPYGLFHGGESNVRQLTYGVRTTRRLLGVRPRTFWEEEFYFFPQLPQMLAQCGYTGACLFFQWTWHTPEVPREPHSLILWEGIDGTRLMTLPRNELNVHQWPEDFDGLLERAADQQISEAANEGGESANVRGGEGARGGLPGAVVQWLELMPSRDWMCRSEVLVGRLKELIGDPRFEVRARTMGEVIRELSEAAAGSETAKQRDSETGGRRESDVGGGVVVPVRRYGMDDVWHGMTLGKNADRHPRASRSCQDELVGAESLAALCALFGRPYPRWDVYPTWELEEAWRELLAAQHHDNHECEGLCGDIARASILRAESLARGVETVTNKQVFNRKLPVEMGRNLLGWASNDVMRAHHTASIHDLVRVREVPPFGFRKSDDGVGRTEVLKRAEIVEDEAVVRMCRGQFEVTIDRESGAVLDIRSPECPNGLGGKAVPLLSFNLDPGGVSGLTCHGTSLDNEWGMSDVVCVEYTDSRGERCSVEYQIKPDRDSLLVHIARSGDLPRPSAGLIGAAIASLRLKSDPVRVVADAPFSVDEVRPTGSGRRKYPEGDWMTSPQWFEAVERPFTAYSLVDLLSGPAEDSPGVLITHDGSQQFLRRERGIDIVLTAYDPWDEARYDTGNGGVSFELRPHRGLTNTARARIGLGKRGVNWSATGAPMAGLPSTFGALDLLNAPNVLAHAFFRESMKSGEHLPDWVGHRMFKESSGACTHPFVYRLVEWDGEPAEVVMKLPGPVAMAAKANLLGEVRSDAAMQRCSDAGEEQGRQSGGGWSWADTRWLEVEHPVEPPEWAKGAMLKGIPITWSQVRFTMRAREIATIYADLVIGRKEWRDLDAKREVWARVHKK